MSVCLLIMCIALCVTLSASSGSFPMFFPKTISPLCTSLPHVFGQQRQRGKQCNAFWWNVAGRCKECFLGVLHNALLGVLPAMCPITFVFLPVFLCVYFFISFFNFFFCVAVCCLQCVPLAQKLGNEAGRSQGGEKTHAAINQQTDFFANGHHYIFANIITDDE